MLADPHCQLRWSAVIAASRHVAFVSRVLLQRFKPPSVIPKLYKISVRIHDPENQAQWFTKVRTTGTSCCLAPIVYRHSQHLADDGRLLVGWYSPVFQSGLPASRAWPSPRIRWLASPTCGRTISPISGGPPTSVSALRSDDAAPAIKALLRVTRRSIEQDR